MREYGWVTQILLRGLSVVKLTFHATFLEDWALATGSGYSTTSSGVLYLRLLCILTSL